jgi:FAD/FMN-containing dehydrogenase
MKGRALTAAAGDFEAVVAGGQWNRLLPARRPDAVTRVADEQDVVEAVRFARANDLKIAVRGGGHNWCHPALRNGGLMIDLQDLNRIVSIDRDARTAVLQPILSNREVQAALNAEGLAYPTGHCPQVKLSGYLLGGGMSWNQGVWGEGYQSLQAVELVTPDGELITASEDENPDWFWAARGAGSGLFAVAVRYHLRLYPLPEAIWTSGYYYALDDLEAVAGWLGRIAPELSNQIELTVFLVQAPPELGSGAVGLVTATAFADSEQEAWEVLKPLAACPDAEALSASPPAPTSFTALFDLSGSMWPEGLRSRVDAMFFDADPAELVAASREHFLSSPSETTLVLFSIYTGPDVAGPLPDAAFSMSAKVYGGPWTQWDEPADDEANSDWHDGCVDRLAPLAVGHYVGESDTAGRPEFAEGSFSRASWERIAELRKRYDPDGLFFSYTEGL